LIAIASLVSLAADRRSEADSDRAENPIPKGAVARLGSVGLKTPGKPRGLCYSPKGDFLAAAEGKKIWRCDARTAEPLPVIELEKYATGLATFPDGQRFAVALSDGRRDQLAVVGLDATTLFSADIFSERLVGDMTAALAVSADGRRVAYRRPDGVVVVTDMERKTTTAVATIAKDMVVGVLAFARDGRFLAFGQWKRGGLFDDTPADIFVHDLTNGGSAVRLTGHRCSVDSLAFAGDEGSLVSIGGTGGRSQSVGVVWDVAKRTELRKLVNARAPLAVLPDARTALCAVANHEDRVGVWDLATGKMLREIDLDGGMPHFLAISPDGERVAVAGGNGFVDVRNVATGAQVLGTTGHHGGVDAVVFTPDGKTLASIGSDDDVRLWDVPTAKERAVLRSVAASPSSLAFPRTLSSFSADGAKVIALTRSRAVAERNVSVWDVSGRLRAQWSPGKNRICCVGLLAGGDVTATVTQFGVQFWSTLDGKSLGSVDPTGRASAHFGLFGRFGQTCA
jgi:WD40 repeat protein